MRVRDDKIHIEKFENILSKSLSVKIGIFLFIYRQKERGTKSSSLFFYKLLSKYPSLMVLSGRVIQVLVNLKNFPRSVAFALEVIPRSL